MPESKKTNGPVTPARSDGAEIEPESHVRLKPKTLQPRTYDELLKSVGQLAAQLQREIVEGVESGSMTEDDAIDRAIASHLELLKDRMTDEEREQAAAKLRVVLLEIWRDTE